MKTKLLGFGPIMFLAIAASGSAAFAQDSSAPEALIRLEKYAPYFKTGSIDGNFIADHIKTGDESALAAYNSGCEKWQQSLDQTKIALEGSSYMIDLMKNEVDYLGSEVELAEINARDACNNSNPYRCENMNREVSNASKKQNDKINEVNASVDSYRWSQQDFNTDIANYQAVCKSLWWF